jgi:hypothetical protein
MFIEYPAFVKPDRKLLTIFQPSLSVQIMDSYAMMDKTSFSEASLPLLALSTLDLGAGSGLPVTGSFMDEVYPFLLQSLETEAHYACNQVLMAETSYPALWPDCYEAFNFYSAHSPLPDATELGWHTFLIGFEYVDGVPYIMSLVHFSCKPGYCNPN